MSELLTIEEAAKKLRKSKRWLQYFLRDHPVDSAGNPLFKQLGRSKLFDETDLLRITQTASARSCPFNSTSAAKNGTTAAQLPVGGYADLLALRTENRRARRGQNTRRHMERSS
jgi:hypothetical protein